MAQSSRLGQSNNRDQFANAPGGYLRNGVFRYLGVIPHHQIWILINHAAGHQFGAAGPGMQLTNASGGKQPRRVVGVDAAARHDGQAIPSPLLQIANEANIERSDATAITKYMNKYKTG